MCKLFERILTEDIYDHLSRNHRITSAQYGFIKGRSTELQLLNCSCDRVNAIDTKCFADTVYIDLAKTFDTVSHNKLIHKLHKYGITGNILQWFSSYLDNTFTEKITELYQSNCPIIYEKVKRKRPDKPWMTNGLKNACRKKTLLYREFLKTRTNVSEEKKKKKKKLLLY